MVVGEVLDKMNIKRIRTAANPVARILTLRHAAVYVGGKTNLKRLRDAGFVKTWKSIHRDVQFDIRDLDAATIGSNWRGGCSECGAEASGRGRLRRIPPHVEYQSPIACARAQAIKKERNPWIQRAPYNALP